MVINISAVNIIMFAHHLVPCVSIQPSLVACVKPNISGSIYPFEEWYTSFESFRHGEFLKKKMVIMSYVLFIVKDYCSLVHDDTWFSIVASNVILSIRDHINWPLTALKNLIYSANNLFPGVKIPVDETDSGRFEV